ncbi:MAG: hypothetical protein PPP58_10320 [Natronomonas sp.]
MGSQHNRGDVFSDGFLVPIAGLLSLVFAVMAGASAYPLLSGSITFQSVLLPVTFAGVSVWFHLVRRNRLEAGSDDEK